jgi:hypothetical protein
MNEKKNRILEIMNSFSEEERLRWELENFGIEANDTGKAILSLDGSKPFPSFSVMVSYPNKEKRGG